MIAFIDDHRATYGVEPICRVLPIAPSTYYEHGAQRQDPTQLSARGQLGMGVTTLIRGGGSGLYSCHAFRRLRCGYPPQPLTIMLLPMAIRAQSNGILNCIIAAFGKVSSMMHFEIGTVVRVTIKRS